jgi:hypothetical protein
MRNLFLALVLANLLFAAWHRWVAEPPAPGGSAANRELASITLVREMYPDAETGRRRGDAAAPASASAGSGSAALGSTGSESADPSAAVETAVAEAAALERCVSVGPFRELAQAAAATSNLRAGGYQPRQRVVEGEVWQGYWVHLEGFASVEEANQVLAELRAEGISDSLVIRGAESSLISLGIFSDISRAGRRREELRALGYEPTVSDRTGRATVYWVDVTLAPEETLDVDALQTTGRIIRLEQRAC